MSASARFAFYLDLISNAGKKSEQEARLVERSQKQMADAVDRTGNRVTALERTMADLSRNTSVERHVMWMDRLGRSVDNAKEKFGSLRRAMAEGSQRLPELLVEGVPAFMAGRGVISKPIKAFANLEEASSALKSALTNAKGQLDEAFPKILANATKLGNQLPGSTKDFVEAAVALKDQGVPPSVIASGGLDAASYFSVVAKMRPADAAETIAKAREVHGLAPEDLLKMADVMARTKSAAGMRPTDFLEADKYVGPGYRLAGWLGLENTKKLAAIQGQAQQNAIDPSQFGTSMRMILLRLAQSDRRSTGKKMDEILGSGSSLDLDFYDSQGNVGTIENMLGQFAKLRKLNPKQRSLVIEQLFGAESSGLANMLVDMGPEGLHKQMSSIDEQASITQRLNIQLETLNSRAEALAGTFENLLAAMGKQLGNNVAKPVTSGLNDVSGSLGDWFNENPTAGSVATIGVGLLAALAARRSANALWGSVTGRMGGSKAASGLIEGAAPAASRFGGASRWLGRAAPALLLGAQGYGVMTDESLTGTGKTREMGGLFSSAFGGWGGWVGGAALGATIGSAVPIVGTAAGGLIGGVLGGLGGSFATRSAYDWLMPSNAQRDYVPFMQPTSHGLMSTGGIQGLGAQLGLGEGKISLDVRVFDERVTATPSVQQQMPLVRLDAGSTDPGSFLGSMR